YLAFSPGPMTLAAQACAVDQRGAVAEGHFQRSEPGLEVAPLVEAFLEDGAADLLGAGGADAALGFPELEAGGLEIEAAEIEQAADVGLEVVHYVFVLDA